MPEAQQRRGGEIEHAIRRRAPHGTAHRHEIAFEEIAAVSARGDVIAQVHFGEARIVERGDGFAVEAIDLHQHPPVADVHEIAPLAEKQVQAAAVVFESARRVLHAEGHLGRLRRHAEFAEEPREIRIRDVIEHHEARVDRHDAACFVHGDGVGVPARVVVLLEERDVVARVEKMRAAEAGDSGPDDGERLHATRPFSPPPRRRCSRARVSNPR